jgi:hypothetical protein
MLATRFWRKRHLETVPAGDACPETSFQVQTWMLSAALVELVDALIKHRERKRDEETPDVLEFISVR